MQRGRASYRLRSNDHLDGLAAAVEQKSEPRHFWGGQIPAFTAWEILFRYLQRQPAETLRSGRLDRFLDAMTARNIGVGVHYLSIPEHPYYQGTFAWKPDDYPNAKRIGRTTVSIPLSARLTDEDAEDVVNAIREILIST